VHTAECETKLARKRGDVKRGAFHAQVQQWTALPKSIKITRMTAQPRVSVIIPTYNRAGLLVETARSVLNQSFSDYEVIVVDDGSTDDTAERLAALDGPIRYIHLEHSGTPEVARNQGIASAYSEMIAFLDDDDLWQPDYLRRQVELLDQDQSLGFAYSDARFIYPDGTLSEPMLLPEHKHADRLLDHLLAGWCLYPSLLVVRRRLLDQIGLMDESLSSQGELDFLLRLAYTSRAGCVSEALALIRRHSSNRSRQRGILEYQNAGRVLENFVNTTPLNLRRRLRARLTLSRLYTHAGLLTLQTGDVATARRHFVHALRWNPLKRSAWAALIRSRGAREI